MKIAETTYRDCCQLNDLQTKNGKTLSTVSKAPKHMWCKHCGAEHEYFRYTDAAGSMDWDYRKVKANPKRSK